MKQAIKKSRILKAYCLGKNSAMEKQLLACGKLRLLPDGRYEVFSKEAVNGRGEIAQKGDFIKVDSPQTDPAPYPNERSFFLSHHRHISGDDYEQINQPLYFWQSIDPMSEEMRFLLDTNKLTLCENDDDRYFNAFLWGAPLSAKRDASLVFYEITRNADGTISDISFNFVEKQYFDENYIILE